MLLLYINQLGDPKVQPAIAVSLVFLYSLDDLKYFVRCIRHNVRPNVVLLYSGKMMYGDFFLKHDILVRLGLREIIIYQSTTKTSYAFTT